MKDLVGDMWMSEDWRPHIEDDLARGALNMPINRRAKTLTIPMDDEPVHILPEHPFCQQLDCPCHDDKELIQEYLTIPWQAGHLAEKEAERLYRGQQIR